MIKKIDQPRGSNLKRLVLEPRKEPEGHDVSKHRLRIPFLAICTRSVLPCPSSHSASQTAPSIRNHQTSSLLKGMTTQRERRDSNLQLDITEKDDDCSAATTPPRNSRDPSPTSANNDSTNQRSQSTSGSSRVLGWHHSKEEFRLASHSITDPRKFIPVLEGATFHFGTETMCC
jgi:hypothetical protein